MLYIFVPLFAADTQLATSSMRTAIGTRRTFQTQKQTTWVRPDVETEGRCRHHVGAAWFAGTNRTLTHTLANSTHEANKLNITTTQTLNFRNLKRRVQGAN